MAERANSASRQGRDPRKIRLAVLSLLAAGVAVGGVFAYRLFSHPSLAPYASLMKPLPPVDDGLRARFFGVTTIQVEDGETAVMIDGFFSRPGFLRLAFGEIAPNRARINEALAKGNVSKLAAVLVSHSHHDHALDSAVVAKCTGALLVGSESTANIGRGHGLAKFRPVKHGDLLTFGRFTIEVFASPHSPGSLFPGTIREPLRPPAKACAYKKGGNFSFLLRHHRGTVLIHPSASFVPGLFENVKADVVFLSIALLGKQSEEFAHDYWREVVRATGAKLVIPIHWDDFLRPLNKPLLPMPHLMDDFDAGMERLLELAEADGVTVRFVPLYKAFDVAGSGR